MNEGQKSFWSMKDRMRLSKGQRQIRQAKVIKDRRKYAVHTYFNGKSTIKDMAQKRSMFIHCLLYSHTHNFVLAHCYQVQIFLIFLLKCLFSFSCSKNYLSSSRFFTEFILQHALYPSVPWHTPHYIGNTWVSRGHKTHPSKIYFLCLW